MKLLKRNPETGETIALVALVGAVGYGIYSIWKNKDSQTPPGIVYELIGTVGPFGLIPTAQVTYAEIQSIGSFDLVPISQVIYAEMSSIGAFSLISIEIISYEEMSSIGSFMLAPSVLPKLGFVISLMYDPSTYPNVKSWYADFNERYYAWFLPTTQLWECKSDLGLTGESGVITVELYDNNLNLVKRSIDSSAFIRNGYAYEFYINTYGLVEIGPF